MVNDERPLNEIARQIVYLEARERARLSQWLELIAEFDRRDGHIKTCHTSTAAWLAHACGIDSRTARDRVRVARRLAELPNVAEAFAESRLSYTKVRAICRADESEDEQALLRLALTRTADQLERHVRQLRSAPSADLDVAERARARRFHSGHFTTYGTYRYFGEIPAEAGVAVEDVIDTGADRLRSEADDPACPQDWTRAPISVRRADAFVAAITGDRVEATLMLHADLESLACTAGAGEPRAGETLYLRDGPAIPSETARRLACDCKITTPLDLGRTTRIVSPALRRALEARDGRVCAIPGCNRTHGLEAHHIIPWVLGGRTDLINLYLVCSYHHHAVHEGGFKLDRSRDGSLILTDPRGREIFSRGSPHGYALAA